VECADLAAVGAQEPSLTMESAEKVVGWAVSACLDRISDPPSVKDGRLQIGSMDVLAGLDLLKTLTAETLPTQRASLRDVVTENEFEKRLLGEVVPPEEVSAFCCVCYVTSLFCMSWS
jgi:hypothetical protein